ncbi:Uncharacterised protein [[Flavobacterium] thermophilum]|nr:Uncharacterised protein [[Flavobacterium] thermophilum]
MKKEFEFVGFNSGDGEEFCFEVDKETFKLQEKNQMILIMLMGIGMRKGILYQIKNHY